MIVLDTNVISEMMKPPSLRQAEVFNWLAQRDGKRVYITTFTVAEILFGIELLPEGKRKAALLRAAEDVFATGFRGRILDFDETAARKFARIAALRVQSGRHVPREDVRIAAIAASHDMAIASRNASDFTDCGIDVINPWEYAGA
jgi:toxin FitB